MPLILEDGTGVAAADSWISEADATDYFTDRSVQDWIDATVPRREAALRNAADYLSFAYRWPGQPSFSDQRLPWPRTGVRSGSGYYPSGDIPTQVIDAQLLLARQDLISPILEKTPVEQRLVEETKAMKGMSKTLKYATSPVDPISGLARFLLVDNILRGIATAGIGGGITVVPIVPAR